MLVTLALVVVISAIIVFFADEFINLFKKFFAIKGVALFVPLLIASWLVYTFIDWCLWALYYYREFLQMMVDYLLSLMPVNALAKPVTLILVIAIVSVLPVLIADILIRRKSYKGFEYIHLTSILIFIVSSTLLLAL